MSTTFDTLTNIAADLDGQINFVNVLDGDMDPNLVLPLDGLWSVRVNWQVTGLVAPGLGGDWNVRVNLESMGEGFEGTLKIENVPVSSVAPATTRIYDKVITLPVPNTIPTFISGAYKLIIVITHTNTGGGVTKRTRMAGFYENYVLDFSDAQV